MAVKISKTVTFNNLKAKKKKKVPNERKALDREVLNQDVEYLGRLQFTAFGKVQESDELRKELPVCRQS